MKLVKAEVITHTQATDKVYIETDLTEATFPFEEKLCLKFDAKAGTGIDYVKTNFPGLRLKECNIHTGIITVHVTGDEETPVYPQHSEACQNRKGDGSTFGCPRCEEQAEARRDADLKKARAEAHQRYMDYMDDASMAEDESDGDEA